MRWRGSLRLLLATLSCALVLGPPAAAAAAPAPRAAVLEARNSVKSLAHQASSASERTLAARARRALTRAAQPVLWINAHDVVAPPYGTSFFADSIAALTDLRRLERSLASAVGRAVRLTIDADRAVASRVIRQALGVNHGLLRAARLGLAAGARDAAAHHVVSSARSYQRAWRAAFSALAGAVAAKATNVPAPVLADAAEEALGSRRIGLAGPVIHHGQTPLTLAGRPELLFIGAEGCPFCAIERWGVIVALSQFGTFSNLHLIQSDTVNSPAIRTFTFLGSTYRSRYLSFEPVEALSNVRRGRGFAPLQRLTQPQRALLDRFDRSAETPFVDVAGRFTKVDSTVQPELLAGDSWAQIANSLTRPTSIPAQAIAGEAEVLTAELCEATNGAPESVCSAAVVSHYEAALPLLDGRGGGCPGTTTGTGGSRRAHASPPPAQVARCRTG
jgi:Domain of unknown function (DUF929)